jgi:hypothetical protein
MTVPDHVYSHHDDEFQDDVSQDDASHSDEGLDVGMLMCNVAPDVFLQSRNKYFETLHKVSRDLLYK